jgi:hypothetical protein
MPKPIDQALDDTSANLVLPGLNQVFSAKKKIHMQKLTEWKHNGIWVFHFLTETKNDQTPNQNHRS